MHLFPTPLLQYSTLNVPVKNKITDCQFPMHYVKVYHKYIFLFILALINNCEKDSSVILIPLFASHTITLRWHPQNGTNERAHRATKQNIIKSIIIISGGKKKKKTPSEIEETFLQQSTSNCHVLNLVTNTIPIYFFRQQTVSCQLAAAGLLLFRVPSVSRWRRRGRLPSFWNAVDQPVLNPLCGLLLLPQALPSTSKYLLPSQQG